MRVVSWQPPVAIGWGTNASSPSWRTCLAACLAVAVASVLVLRVPSYDPTAWLIWGREILHGSLDTSASPSWKPLPVAGTTVFALAGSGAAPLLWLIVARTGGLMGLVLAFRLARRLGGPAAGWGATLSLALATDYVYNAVRGDSEGLLVALVLAAILMHLNGRRLPVFAVGALAAGLRPETWPFLAAYGLWLVVSERRWTTLAAVGGTGALILVVWFLPDYLATGDWLRGASRATQPEPGSPAQAAFPFGAALVGSVKIVMWPLYVGTAVAIAAACRTPAPARDRALLAVGVGAVLLTLETAAFAEIGFTGNVRYFTLSGALFAVVGSVGLRHAVMVVGGRWRTYSAVALLALCAVLIPGRIDGMFNRAVRIAGEERAMRSGLRDAIEVAGGAAAVRACGHIAATPYQRSGVAYALRVHQSQVGVRASLPGVMFVRRGQIGTAASQLAVLGANADWTVRGTCR